MTTKERVLELLYQERPCKLTQREIWRRLDAENACYGGVHSSYLSSLLVKMTDQGLIQRCWGHGPRNGYGYFVKTWK